MDADLDRAPANPEPAARGLKARAAAIDSIVLVAPQIAYQWRRGVRAHRAGVRVQRPWWLSALAPAKAVMEEQLGTPGNWIVGLRTVDRRTGRRVQLWRTAAIASFQLIAGLTQRRWAGPAPQAARADLARQAAAIRKRLAEDPDALREAMMRLHRENRVEVNGNRRMAFGLVSALLAYALRRRLAPTMVIAQQQRHKPSN
jgi:hypothetical protein